MTLKNSNATFWEPDAAPEHWARADASVSSMLATVLSDWQQAAAYGGCLPGGKAVSAAGVLALLQVPEARPSGLLAGAAFAAGFTGRCIAASAKAQMLASRLRHQGGTAAH